MRILIVGLTMLLLWPILSTAQESSIEGFNEPQFRLRGADIPLYFVVESFFRRVSNLSKQWDDSYEYFLEEHMGIEPDSPAASVVLSALQAAEPILEIETVNMELIDDEQAFGAYQYDTLKRKALGLREVYLKLTEELDLSGYSPEKLQSFLDREFRSSISITIVGSPFEGSLIEIVKVFEQPDFDGGRKKVFMTHLPRICSCIPSIVEAPSSGSDQIDFV